MYLFLHFQQIAQKLLLKNPQFTKKLAENINRSLHPEADLSVVLDEADDFQIPPTPELDIDAILDAQVLIQG